MGKNCSNLSTIINLIHVVQKFGGILLFEVTAMSLLQSTVKLEAKMLEVKMIKSFKCHTHSTSPSLLPDTHSPDSP
jgi:hypothetical protein